MARTRIVRNSSSTSLKDGSALLGVWFSKRNVNMEIKNTSENEKDNIISRVKFRLPNLAEIVRG